MKTFFPVLCLVALFTPLAVSPAQAALPNFTSIWEVESGGNDTNGGGADSALVSTDMSQFPNKNAASCTSCQSATVNISTTDGVCAGTTTFVSATANFSAAIVGNFIHLNGGSGSLTAVWKEVTAFTNATTVTIDAACAAGTGITLNIGGALLTVGQASANGTLATATGTWVKVGGAGPYSISAMISVYTGATNNGMAFMSGYNVTRGDLNFSNCFTASCPVLQAAAGLGGADNAIIRFSGTPSGTAFSNFILDCNNQTFTAGLRWSGAFSSGRNIYAKNCSDPAFDFANIGMCDRCTSTNSPAAGITGGHPTVSALNNANFNIYLQDVALLGSTVNGTIALDGGCGGMYLNVVIAHFTGTTATAHQCNTLEGDQSTWLGTVIDDVTLDGFQFAEANNIDTRPVLIRNAVISNVGRNCFNQTGTLVLRTQNLLSDHNFCNTTTSTFYANWPAGNGDVALSVNPFTNAAGNVFTLNSTAGGGAAVKGAGFPGTVSAGVGHLDGGALQSAAAAAGAQAVSAYAQ